MLGNDTGFRLGLSGYQIIRSSIIDVIDFCLINGSSILNKV